MIEEALNNRGFERTQNEQPWEDYWLLEGVSPSLLVEKEGAGWKICRSPTLEEPQGQWVDVAQGLQDEEALKVIDDKIAGI